MDAEYFRIHNWLIRNHGTATFCENEACTSKNPKRFEWALLKGKDHKRDRNNYIQLCPSCHRKYDFTEQERQNKSKAAMGRKVREEVKAKISERMKGKGVVPVLQFSLSGELIAEHEGVTEAAKKTGISQSGISNNLTRRAQSAGGFKWQYKA